MNYIKSLRDFLENDTDMQELCTNIKRLRVWKDDNTRPLIIFSEMSKENPYWWEVGRKGVDTFPVLFDCVVDYSDSIKGREMRELLKFKLNWWTGALTSDWVWEITHIEDTDLWYDEEKDLVRFGSVYLFKNKYDYTAKRGL